MSQAVALSLVLLFHSTTNLKIKFCVICELYLGAWRDMNFTEVSQAAGKLVSMVVS
jgi:hypothetical protein